MLSEGVGVQLGFYCGSNIWRYDSIGLFSGITRVQDFSSQSILNSDPVPCTDLCFEPVLHMEPHPEFLHHSWFFPILVLYHTHIFLSLLTLH